MSARSFLLAVLSGMISCGLFLTLLGGFVSQDEGPAMRKKINLSIAKLCEEDLPVPIESLGDAAHLWSLRKRAQGTVQAEQMDAEARKAERSYSPMNMLLHMEAESEHDGLVVVPLLSLDGAHIPQLVATQPLALGEALDSSGSPLRWQDTKTMHHGYTPFSLRRAPLFLEDETHEREALVPKIVVRLPPKGQRGQAYQGLIVNFSRRYGLDPMLIKAIIQSESNFNALLVSPRSAIGLMQVLPTTAAGEVHRFLYGSKGSIGAVELFEPETNIRYGTTYIHILMSRYFSGVKDALSREYLTVAAYNMGPNRVVRTFGRTPQQAADVLNSMSSEEVYLALVSRLPRQETRNYVVKVRSLKQQYAAAGK